MKKFILKITRKVWRPYVLNILCRAHERRVINSEQLHLMASYLDDEWSMFENNKRPEGM